MNVLIDLGGVLMDFFPGRALGCLSRLSGRPPEELERPVMEIAKLAFDSGRIDPAEFSRQVAAACRKPLTVEQIRRCWCDVFEDAVPMQRLVERLVHAHPCYLLSNTDPWHYQLARERLSLLAAFRGHCLSFEVGRLKPDPGYYRTMFERFELRPADCVLVDDRAENVESIVAMGAQGIIHQNAAATEAALAALGVRA